MNQDPAVRNDAFGVIERLFRNVGRSGEDPGSANVLGGLGVELAEFVSMPADLARIFVDMSFDLTELVLNSLAEAGIVLVRGLTPA